MSISAFMIFICLQFMTLYQSLLDVWIIPQPQKNVWITPAHALQQDHLCLSTSAAENPMSTCLVEIPGKISEYPSTLVRIWDEFNKKNLPNTCAEISRYWGVSEYAKTAITNPLGLWWKWVYDLPTADAEPQEFELLGSTKTEYCVQFDFTPHAHPDLYDHMKQHKVEVRADQWCTCITKVGAPSAGDSYACKLDKGKFLICGNQAYPGIPSRLLGAPCTLGRLSLAFPNMTQIPIWQAKQKIVKRGAEQLDKHCSKIYHWAKSKRVAVSVFLPWVAAAKSLSELGHLECWVTKQANLTSIALSNFREDEEVTRKVTLQNWAAIDFLLLVHRHGCQEFKGLCCFNLSSRRQSVHLSIREMKDLISSVKQEHDDWFRDMFKNWNLSGLL